MSWRSSTSVTTRSRAALSVADARRRRRAAARRTARRAARAPGGGRACARVRGPSARWMSASVCSTESWRWAAISERSSERMRSRRSSAEVAPQPHDPGPEQQRDTDAGGQHGQAERRRSWTARRRTRTARPARRRAGARRRRRATAGRGCGRPRRCATHTSPKPMAERATAHTTPAGSTSPAWPNRSTAPRVRRPRPDGSLGGRRREPGGGGARRVLVGEERPAGQVEDQRRCRW